MRNDYGMVLQACLIQPSVIQVISDDFDKTILVSGDNLDETKIATDEELYYMLTDDLKVMDKLINDFIYTDTAAEYLKLLSEKKLDLFEETYLYYYYLAIFALENLNVQEEMSYNFDTMLHIYPTDDMDYSVLSDEEKAILDRVILKFKDYKAKDIVDYMHGESAYLETKSGEIIPFSLAKEIRAF